MAIDWTISVGSIIQIAFLLTTAICAFYGLKSFVQRLDLKVTMMHENVGLRIGAVEKEIKDVADILRMQAVQTEQITGLRRDLEEMKRGEGFIFPISRGAYEAGGGSR